MKSIKIMIIAIIIIVILFIGILSIYNKNRQEDIVNEEEEVVSSKEEPDATPYDADDLKDDNIFFELCNIIQNYLSCMSKNALEEYTTEEKSEIAYDVLSPDYVKKNGITKENIIKAINNQENSMYFTPLKAKVKYENNYTKYLISGLVDGLENQKSLGEKSYYIFIDNNTNAFAIEPINSEVGDIDEYISSELEANENNEFRVSVMSNDDVAKMYLMNYKSLMIYHPEVAYNLLDKEYKENKFQDVEKYKAYINDNSLDLKSIRLSEYLVNTYKEYNQYVCKDQYGNVYIFNATASMQYTFMLDNYTILTSKFKEEYNAATDTKKIQMNVQRFIQMINNYDFETAYNLLDTKFRNRYFTTEESFREYFRNNYYKYNNISYDRYSIEDGIYIYKVLLRDKTDDESEWKELNVIMKLGEGTGFVMSFEVNE